MRREEKWKGKKEKGGREGERREKVKGWEKKRREETEGRTIACVGNRSVGTISIVIQQQ